MRKLVIAALTVVALAFTVPQAVRTAGFTSGGGGLTSPVGVADGGTGRTSFTNGGVLLGSGTGAITPMSVLADGEFVVGDGSGDPVPESGGAVRASLGLSSVDTATLDTLTVNNNLDAGGSFTLFNTTPPSVSQLNSVVLFASDDAATSKLWLRDEAGSNLIMGGIIDRDVVVAEVVNSTSETTVYSFSVPGGTLGTNRAIRIKFFSDYLNNSGGASALTLRFKYGATTWLLHDYLTELVSDASRRTMIPENDIMLSAANATNAQVGYGATIISAPTALAGESFSGAFVHHSAHITVAEDSTAALALEITVEHGGLDANISFRMHWVQLELL